MGSLPPGFRFHPTDEELVGYYLKKKVQGHKIELEVIPVIDIYKYDPWELPDKSFLPSQDMEWFFFCPRDKKYPNGLRTNRATRAGYWKATGKDRKVVSGSSIIGYRKTLVFYQGRAPLGDRTKWMMHEYRLCDEHSQGSPSFRGAFALCRVVMKTGAKLSSTDSIGKLDHKRVDGGPNEHLLSISSESGCPGQYNQSAYFTPISSPYNATQIGELDTNSTRPSSSNVWVSPELILDSSKDYSLAQEAVSNCLPEDQCQQTTVSWKPSGQQDISRSSSYSNFNGEIEYVDDLNGIGNMPPYLSNVDYMGYYENEYIEYERYDQIDSHAALF